MEQNIPNTKKPNLKGPKIPKEKPSRSTQVAPSILPKKSDGSNHHRPTEPIMIKLK